MHVTLRQLRVALAVAHHGSFRRAAEEMHLSQPALSSSVAELEATLGVSLFDRTSRMVRVTSVGRPFLDALRRSITDLDMIVREVGTIAQSKRGRVVVSSVASAAGTLMSEVWKRVAERFPQIELDIRDDVATNVANVVRFGEADFGITAQSTSLSEELVFDTLLKEKYSLVCTKEHRFASKRRVTWSDLSGEILIGFTPTAGAYAQINNQTLKGDVRFARILQMSQLSTVHAMAEASIGITILPHTALPVPDHPTLVSRPLCGPTLMRTLGVLRRRDHSLSPAALAVRELLQEVVAEMME
ncbi:LysR substrate-binding domain-containing protein [Caballeronia sp. LZ029]|uniref:LysR family transcriptional regulator n=1 Tax=Caballeronia sp. LZ029 TaxID=3038564 RepID=UPI0028602044|nr:LysR substrate-binding domain-containing protein [Caballeronia sp. LZ029]MDR5744619.1 LysR substrate-binding domain-containing protein [Caballeronia sp. LZ029]